MGGRGIIKALGAGLALASAPVSAQQFAQTSFEGAILTLHNQQRAIFHQPSLSWNPALAAGAAVWAAEMARTGMFNHSNRAARPGIGENLAMGKRGYFAADQLMKGWVDERANFRPGLFPTNAIDGNWVHVAHFTQMIWPTTTKVGCAMVRGQSNEFLVCRYSPKGNVDGQYVGANRGERG